MTTAASLAEHLVQLEVGHLVSSASMVSRAYLSDNCVGVVVDTSERGYFLVSSAAVLAPDLDELRRRGFEKGGIPVEHGNPRLVKITLRWGDNSVDLNNPEVLVGPNGAAAVSLAIPASLGERIRSGDGQRPVVLLDDGELALGDEVVVPVATELGPLLRWARVSSDSGFAGAGVALNLGLAADLAGSAVFTLEEGESRFRGLAQPWSETASILLPASAVAGLTN